MGSPVDLVSIFLIYFLIVFPEPIPFLRSNIIFMATSKKTTPSAKKIAKKAPPARPAAGKKTKVAKGTSSPKQAASKSAPRAKKSAVVTSPVRAKAASSERETLIQEIRRRLVDEKARLVAEAEATRNDLPDDETYPDLGDQATAETDRSFMLRLRSRESKLIKKIDDTIELIDKGEYGICEECGENIDPRRLEARPVTTYCIECKTRQEEDEKLR